MKRMHQSYLAVSLCLLLTAYSWADTITPEAIIMYPGRPAGIVKTQLGGLSFGGGAHTYLKPDIVSRLADLPVPLARLEAVPGSYPNLYDPKTQTYDWTDLDREIQELQQRGATIILNIFYTPGWLSSRPQGSKTPAVYYPPRDMEQWCKLIEDIVRHVNVDKKFGIKYWEIWNEPSGNSFWKDAWAPVNTFWDMYTQTWRAIKRADPTALVGGIGDNAAYPIHYEKLFKHALKNGVTVDFLTCHWYAQWQKDAWKEPLVYTKWAQNLDQLYKKYFNKNTELFWTEWNLHAESAQFPMEQQAAFMVQAMYAMQNSSANGACFFRVEHYGPGMSVLSPKNQAMQAPGYILNLWSRLQSQMMQVDHVPDGLCVLATIDPQTRKLAIMIARYDTAPDARPCNYQFKLATGKKYQFSSLILDSTNVRTQGPMPSFSPLSVNNATITTTLEPFSVMFVNGD